MRHFIRTNFCPWFNFVTTDDNRDRTFDNIIRILIPTINIFGLFFTNQMMSCMFLCIHWEIHLLVQVVIIVCIG